MGLSDKQQKSTQTSDTTNRYGFQNVPDTPDIVRARQGSARIDPSIGYRAAEQGRQLDESFINPAGGATTPQIRDAILRGGRRDIAQRAGQEAREGASDVNRLNMGRDMGLANLTRPILTQTGSSSSGTGTVRQSESPWGTIASVGSQAATMSL